MSRVSTTDLVNAIFVFCELYSGKTMYPYQEQFSKRVIRSVLENDGAEITALFARQSGKSETIAITVGGLMIILPRLANMPMFANDPRLSMFKSGLWVGIFAPSLRQAQITYNRIRARLESKAATVVLTDPDFRVGFSTSNGQTCSLTNGSFATSVSASEGSNIEGESLMLIICEECQDISDFKIKKSIHPMGSAYNASRVKIGTATTFKGNFYDAIERNKKEYVNGVTKIRNHFEYDYTVAIKYNERYRKYVEGEKRILGEHSDEFRMAYKLEWILQRGMFCDIEKIELENGEDTLETTEYDREKVHVAGIDVAGKNDSTVITIVEVDWTNPVVDESKYNSETGETEIFKAYYTYIKAWKEIFGDDYEEQYAEIMDFLKNYNIKRLMCDATKESSLAHRIRANVDFEVVPFIFTDKSKSEMYKHLDGEIKSKRARIPRGTKTLESREYIQFTSQLGDLQKGYRGQYMVVSHPEERGAHDDYPDSWALAVYAAKEEGVTTKVETQKNNTFYGKNNSKFYNTRNKLTARRR